MIFFSSKEDLNGLSRTKAIRESCYFNSVSIDRFFENNAYDDVAVMWFLNLFLHFFFFAAIFIFQVKHEIALSARARLRREQSILKSNLKLIYVLKKKTFIEIVKICLI